MRLFRAIWGALVVLCTTTTMVSVPASAQQQGQQGQKPNILFIMGDDKR
jgi:arylsulfatase